MSDLLGEHALQLNAFPMAEVLTPNISIAWDGSSSLTSGDNFFTIKPEIEGGLFEEIVVSGLAMVEHRAKRNRHGFGGAVAAGLRMAGHPFKGSS